MPSREELARHVFVAILKRRHEIDFASHKAGIFYFVNADMTTPT
jgi:hypothetical protein